MELGSIRVNAVEFENKRKTSTNLNTKEPRAPVVFRAKFFPSPDGGFCIFLWLHCGLSAEPIIYS